MKMDIELKKAMNYKKAKLPRVHLPRIPVYSNPTLTQEEFWQQKEQSGAINAFRQLNSTLHRGGRKVTLLPGGKLQPLFKNDLHLENGPLGPNSTLPHIPAFAGPKQILAGDVDNLPPPNPTTVRIYLCSNYEDMKHERMQLLKTAVPQLQEFCSRLGLRFQLVDLHWGVNGEWHQWTPGGLNRKLRQIEIKDCQRLSLGPHFVCLLGDRYGMQQLPETLTETEHQMLTELANDCSLANAELLTKCYTKDENACPVHFVFENPDELDELKTLRSVILETMRLAVIQNKLSQERFDELTMSALDDDIRHGILNTKDPRGHCLCYHREFRNIGPGVSPAASEYVDTLTDSAGATRLDDELRLRVTRLAKMILEHLGIGNYHSYYLSWTDKQLEEEPDFQSYLRRLTEDFVKDTKEMIMAGYKLIAKDISAKRSVTSMVLDETLFHMHKCSRIIAAYTRNMGAGLFARLKAFLQDPLESNRPFVIWGKSGTGKTTAAAIIARQLKNWFGDECIVVLRFLGDTWQSSSIHRTITNVTLQICLAYGMHCPPVASSFRTLHEALLTFRSVLDQVSKTSASSRPLFIILDGIDQLYPFQESLKALWAMRDFPPNVHMIVLTVDKLGDLDLTSALVSTITTTRAVAEIPPIDEDEIDVFTQDFMKKSERRLSEQQMALFTQTVNKNPQPLYVTQLMLKALRFHSSQEVTSNIPTTVEGLFAMQIHSLEEEIGQTIVRHFVAFITASPIAVLETDLLDLLTSSEEVMSEVYAVHHHPTEKIFLFPQNLLIRMKHGMRDFLCERLLLGRNALAWNHREIYQAASNYYNIIYPGIAENDIADGTTDFSLMLHEHFVNMFFWQHRTNLLSRTPVQMEGANGDWTLLSQPQEVHVENTQKLHRAPMHLCIMVPVEGLARVKQTMLFNFHWIYTKLESAGLAVVMQDVVDVLLLAKGLAAEGVLENDDDSEESEADPAWKEIDLLYDFLQLALPSLSENINNLPAEVLARLRPLQASYPGIANLVKGAQEHLDSCRGPCIIPLHSSLQRPGRELRHTFPGATHVLACSERTGQLLTFSQRSGVRVWNLDALQLTQHFSVNKEQALSGILPGHSSPIVIIGHYSHLNHVMEISVWSIVTGVTLVSTTLPHRFETLALSLDDQLLFFSTVSQEKSRNNGVQMRRYILAIKASTKEIVYTLPCETRHSEGVHKIIPIAGVRDGPNALITLGGHKSRDLVYWDLDKAAIEYHLELEYFTSQFHINEEKSLGIGCSPEDGALVVIDLREGIVKQTVQQAAFQDMQDLYISRSGDFVVLATARDGVVIYSLPKKAQVKTLARPMEGSQTTAIRPSKLAMDETEHFLFVGYYSGVVDLYSIVTGEMLAKFSSHTKAINTLHVLADDCLLSASDDNEAKLWHYGRAILDHITNHVMSGDDQFECELAHKTKSTNPTLESDTNVSRKICCLFLAKNGELIVAGSCNGPIQIWTTEALDEPPSEISENCEYGLTDLYITYKDKLLVGHCVNPHLPSISTLQVWNVDSGRPISFDKDAVVSVFTSCPFPSDDRILTISPSVDDQQKGIIVAIYDLFEMKCLASLQCNIYSNMDSTNLRLLGFTTKPESEDMELESISGNETLPTQEPPATGSKLYAILDYFPSEGLSFFFTFVIHGDGMKDISMDHHEPIHLDTMSPKCNVVMPNNICVSGTKDGSLVVWNASSQAVVTNFCDSSLGRFKRQRQAANMHVHLGPVTCLTSANDGVHIVSGGADAKVKIWNLDNNSLVHTFSRHTDQIIHISISVKNLIVSTSMDNKIAMWDLEKKNYLCGFFAHDYVSDVSVKSDKSRLVATVNKDHPTLLVLKLSGI